MSLEPDKVIKGIIDIVAFLLHGRKPLCLTIVLCIFSGLGLLFPDAFDWLSLARWQLQNRTLFSWLFAITIGILIARFLSWINIDGFIGDWIQNQRAEREKRATIDGLSQKELEILCQFIRQNGDFLELDPASPAVRSLCDKRLIYRSHEYLAGTFPSFGGAWERREVFAIAGWARKRLSSKCVAS